MATVVLLGTLDTKGLEYAFLRDVLVGAGVDVTIVHAGVFAAAGISPDVDNWEVARRAGAQVDQLAAAGDRGAAVATMSDGAAQLVKELFAAGRLDGILGLGGTGGTALVTRAMRELPVGVPKLMVSTVASGDTRQYMGALDIAMMYSVVDIAGLNKISRRILANAAGAMAGMLTVGADSGTVNTSGEAGASGEAAGTSEDKALIGATMFGVTTPCVQAARRHLEGLGYEVLVFHATGTGGDSMEALARAGLLAGVLDITTTELADELVGGVFAAGAGRLGGAGAAGIPQVVSVGALDMVNFGPPETVPDRFSSRTFYQHNPSVTLMRTTPEECAELGKRLAERISGYDSPVTVFLPLKGVSLIDTQGQPFYDPVADAALFDAIRANLTGNVHLVEVDTDVNDEAFAVQMAETLHRAIADGRVGCGVTGTIEATDTATGTGREGGEGMHE